MSCFDRQRLSLNVSGVAGAGAGDVAQFLGGTQGPCHSLLAQSLGPADPGAVGWISWGPWGLEWLGMAWNMGIYWEYTGNILGIYWEYTGNILGILDGFPLVGGVSRVEFPVSRFEAGNLVT